MAKSTSRRRGRQLSLALVRGRGGPGRGQGRTKRRFDYVPHRARAYLDPNHPVRVSNRRLGRSGTVFADRYHARDITNPTQCRHALAYVLGNQRHHAYAEQASYPRGTVDPCSSAAVFAGWAIRRPRTWAHAPPTDTDDRPTVSDPRTWLLRGGWKRGGGLISLSNVPGLPVGAPPLPVW